jgi:chitodextrinase
MNTRFSKSSRRTFINTLLAVFLLASQTAYGLTFQDINQTQNRGQVLGAATPALVSHAVARTTSGTATTSGIDTSGATLLVVISADYSKDSTTDTISDSLGNTWVHLNNYATPDTSGNVTLWYAKNPIVGPNQTFSGRGQYISIFVSAWSGIDTTAPFDVQNGGGCNSCSSLQTGSITPSSNGELIISGLSDGATDTLSINSGFTTIDAQRSNSTEAGAHAYFVQPTSGAINPTWTGSVSYYRSVIIAAFKPASSGTIPPDTTPPVISGTLSSGITSSSANIGWSTDENSDSQVDYGATASYGQSSVLNSTLTTSHSISLSSLSASTLYHYRVNSKDASGNLAVSSDQTFTTTAGVVSDTTAPSTPTNFFASAISSSQINLSWTASTDNVGVTGYKVYRAGTQIGTAVTNTYSDSGLTASTAYSYTVSAYDAAGNNSSQSSSASATTQAAVSGIVNIPSNTWVKVNPTYTGAPNGGSIAPASWNNQGVYDPVSHRTISYDRWYDSIRGGSIYANAVLAYDPSNNVVSVLKLNNWKVTGLANGSYTTDPLSENTTDPTPVDRHPLGAWALDSVTNSIYLVNGLNQSSSAYFPATYHPVDTWKFGLNTNTWTKVTDYTNPNHPPSSGGTSMVYDSADRKMVFFYTPQSFIGTKTALFDLNTNQWSLINQDTTATGIQMGGAGLAYDPVRNRILAYGSTTGQSSSQLWAYSVFQNKWTRLADAPVSAGGSGFAYDSNHDVFLALTDTNNTVIYNPSTNTWAQVTSFANRLCTNSGNCYQSVTYNPAQDVFVFQGGSYEAGTLWYLYRYNGGVSSGDVIAPTVPSGLSSTAVSSSQINLSWTASTDNVAVTGYKIYRGGVQVAITATNSYSDSNLTASTAYSYTVAAFDAAGNNSVQSSSASATTQALVTPPPTGGNTITITETTGSAQTNYPVQIGRPFVQGELPSGQLPQAFINNSGIPTQVDVKERWSDGSLKHAIISFLISTLSANQSVVVTFASGATVGNTPISKTEMLNNYNFDAQMVMTGGITATPSARQVITDWDGSSNSDLGPVKIWTSGPIATTVILADHSSARKYDVGSDANRSIRPIFDVTFWSGINKAKVRFIAEDSNTIALQDQTYNLALTLGQASPQTVYTKTNMLQHVGSRWTKEFWLGGTPSAINLDNNLAYVEQTKFIPNFDSSKTIPSSVISSDYATWNSTAKDLYDGGLWAKYMPQSGGRPEIGPYPKWTVQWLYTGDKRSKEIAFTQANLAAAWPMHLREGNSAKVFDQAGIVNGLGKVLSIAGRPTLQLWDDSYTYSNTSVTDRITPVGTKTNGSSDPYQGWWSDGAHQPDAFSPEYALSGDYFYLEEMQFWAGYSAARYNGNGVSYSRGPTGKEGGIDDEVRGEAWVFRNRVQTAFMTPDGTPEKSFFDQLTKDAIAKWEGQRKITSTGLSGNTEWNWANTVGQGRWNGLGVPPLHNWEDPDPVQVDPSILDSTKVTAGESQWMENWLIYSLGRAKELGYPTDSLLTWVSSNLTGQITDPTYDPFLTTQYRTPTAGSGAWFTTWAQVKAGYLAGTNSKAFYDPTNNEQGYAQTAIPAVSMIASESNGPAAWNWISQNILAQDTTINTDPKWDIIPRTAVITPPATTPTINSFTAGPSSVALGSPSTLQWSVSNATSLSINQSVGTVTGLTSKVVSPVITTTYTLTATNAQGSVTSTAVVTVTAPVAPVISNLIGSNTTASSTTISWVTDHNSDGQVDYGVTAAYGSSSAVVDASPMTMSHTITLTNLTPATLYHFHVKSKDSNNLTATTQDFTFTTLSLPLPPAPIIVSFSALPPSITTGGSSVLSWTTANASSLSLDNGIGSVTGQTSKSVSPSQTITYTLTASNGTATATAQTIVSVGSIIPTSTPPSITSFLAAPGTITAGGSGILSWVITGSPTPTVSIDNGIGTVTGTTKTVAPTQTTTYTLTATNSAGAATAQASLTVSASSPSGGSGGSGSAGSGGGSGSNGGATTSSPITVYIPPAASTPVSQNISLKLINSSGTYYLIINNILHGVTNPGMLNSYGFSLADAKPATAQDMTLPKGSLLLPGDGSLVKSKQDQTVYLISNQQRYGFTSAKVFLSLGFKFSSVLVVTNPELQALPKASNLISDPTSRHLPGLDINRNGAVYWIGPDNTLHPYPDLTTYNSWHIKGDFTRVVPSNQADLSLPIGEMVMQRKIQ